MTKYEAFPEERDWRSKFTINFKRLWRVSEPVPQSNVKSRQIATNEPNLCPAQAVDCSKDNAAEVDDMQKKSQEASMWNAMRMAAPDRRSNSTKNGPRKIMGFEGKVASARKERLEKQSSDKVQMEQSSAKTMFR